MRPLKGQGELLLYLDYDGALSNANVWRHPRRGPYIQAPPQYTLFQHAQLLETVLAPYPEVRIVLSTSWVRHYGFHRAAKRLPKSLRERAIGATFHSGMRAFDTAFTDMPRGVQILLDVKRRKPRDWLAIDDDSVGWPDEIKDKLVCSDPTEGISAPAVLAELKVKLAVMCSGTDASLGD